MRFITKIWLILAVVTLVDYAAWAASFTASLDRDTMMVGEQAALSLTFEDVQPQGVPRLPVVLGLQFQYAGPSSSFKFDNGQSSTVVTFNYIVTAQHEGEFNIPGLQIKAGGQTLSSQPLKIVVTKPSAPSVADEVAGKDPAFLKLSVKESKVYVGQPMVAQLELYLRDDVQNFAFQVTGAPADGFNVGKIAEPQGMRRREQIGNHVYTVIPYSVPLTDIRSGPLTLGPFTANVIVLLPAQNQGGDLMSQFFNRGEQKQLALTTAPVNVEALPLPDQDKPATFTGAIGNFTMNATAGPTKVTVGDPITVRVQISGNGALDSVTLPPQDAWHDFKTYPPTAKLETSDAYGFRGTKTFEQIVSPQNTDVHELPALTFSFFNPEDGKYHILTQPAVPIVVSPAGATPVPTLAAAKNATSTENQTPQDVLPIKENLGTLSQSKVPLVAQPAFLAAQSLPVLAFIAALVWRKRTDNLANNPRLRRRRTVAQLVASGTNDLRKHAAANQPDQFFGTLFHLLQEQLGERLDCPASAITENVVDEHPLLRAAPSTLRDGLRELFQLCNQARYAPVRGTSELNSVTAQFEKVSGELQGLKA